MFVVTKNRYKESFSELIQWRGGHELDQHRYSLHSFVFIVIISFVYIVITVLNWIDIYWTMPRRDNSPRGTVAVANSAETGEQKSDRSFEMLRIGWCSAQPRSPSHGMFLKSTHSIYKKQPATNLPPELVDFRHRPSRRNFSQIVQWKTNSNEFTILNYLENSLLAQQRWLDLQFLYHIFCSFWWKAPSSIIFFKINGFLHHLTQLHLGIYRFPRRDYW